jgi:hypothetical protein
MAELNFGLLTPPGSQSIGNAFAQGMDQAAVARAQENQNALAQYTLGKAKREDEQQNELYAAVRQPGFKLDIGTAMRFGAPGLAAYKAQQEGEVRGVDLQIKRNTLAGQPTKQMLDESNLLDKVLGQLQPNAARAQTVDDAVRYVDVLYDHPIAGAYALKIQPREQAIAQAKEEFVKNPDKWRAVNTNVNGLQIVQATMPKPQVFGGVIGNANPISGPVGERIPNTPYIPQSATAKAESDLKNAIANGAPPAEIAALTAARDSALVVQQQRAQQIAISGGQLNVAQGNLALRNREYDPYGMFPQVMGGGGGGGGARQLNNLGTTTPLATPAPQGAAPTAPAPQAVAPASIAPMTVADAFKNNVTGPAFVAVLPPTVRPLVESILRYDQRPPSPATKRGQQLLELVNQADPTYDASKAQTRYIAKQTFVKGPVADAIASTNTAIDHMDTLATYGANLNNADVRLANAAKQAIAAAFGADAPTTFDATRRIVGQEVVKAVVANGGSMREREEAADAFNRANSPAQLAGVIKSYQALLGGRLKSTQLRYENDTGLKDFQTKLLPATIRAISGATPAAAGAGATVKPAATTAKPAAAIKISGNAEYDKLPSGTLFIDPEGTQRRKP